MHACWVDCTYPYVCVFVIKAQFRIMDGWDIGLDLIIFKILNRIDFKIGENVIVIFSLLKDMPARYFINIIIKKKKREKN